MSDALKLFLLSLAVFVAMVAERLFVPNVVPIGWAEEPQLLWAVEAEFLRRATQCAVLGVMGIVLFVSVASSIDRSRGVSVRK